MVAVTNNASHVSEPKKWEYWMCSTVSESNPAASKPAARPNRKRPSSKTSAIVNTSAIADRTRPIWLLLYPASKVNPPLSCSMSTPNGAATSLNRFAVQ